MQVSIPIKKPQVSLLFLRNSTLTFLPFTLHIITCLPSFCHACFLTPTFPFVIHSNFHRCFFSFSFLLVCLWSLNHSIRLLLPSHSLSSDKGPSLTSSLTSDRNCLNFFIFHRILIWFLNRFLSRGSSDLAYRVSIGRKTTAEGPSFFQQ